MGLTELRFTGFCRVLQSFFRVLPGSYRVFLGLLVFYLVLPGSIGFYWVLKGPDRFYRVFSGFKRVSSGFSVSSHVLPDFTGFHRVLADYTGFHRVLADYTGSHRVPMFFLPASIGFYRVTLASNGFLPDSNVVFFTGFHCTLTGCIVFHRV